MQILIPRVQIYLQTNPYVVLYQLYQLYQLSYYTNPYAVLPTYDVTEDLYLLSFNLIITEKI